MRARQMPRLIAIAATTLLPIMAQAGDPPTLSGTWSSTAMNERWNVGDWGSACGPRPSASGAAGGTVTIAQQGVELAISGAGRAYHTTDCWDQVPGGTRAHSGGARAWRTVCKAQPNDPRQATVTTTLSATDSAISFDETGQYQFVIQGQNCTASVRRTRSYTLVHREGDALPPAPSPTPAPIAAATATAAERGDECASPGPPARVEVRPARKLMKPGERFTFRTVVADAHGCALDLRPTWELATTGAKLSVNGAGTVSIEEDALDGTVELVASVAGRRVPVSVEVATAARYEALLAGSGTSDGAGQDDAAVVTLATGSIGGAAAVAPDSGRTRKLTFIAIVAAAATVVAGVGLALLRKSKRAAPTADDDSDGAPIASNGSPTPPVPRPLPHPLPREAAPAIEPRPPAPQPPLAPRGKICPTCGGRFGAEASFCGKDGTSLVLVN